MGNNKENVISIFELFHILKKRWLLLLVTGIFTATIGFFYSSVFITPQYRASAKMMIDTRNDLSSTITSSQLSVAKQLALTFAEIIKTNAVLNPVIEELGLEETHLSLKGKLSIRVIEDTQILQINLTYPDSKKALEILEKIVEVAPKIINESKDINSGRIILIDIPVSSSSPISPNISRNTVIAFLVGFVGVYVFFLVKRILDNKIRSAEDILTIFDLPVLGVIPDPSRIASK